MFISVRFRILSFRTLPFILQEKIRIEFSANYPFATFRIPHSAFRKIPLPLKCGARGSLEIQDAKKSPKICRLRNMPHNFVNFATKARINNRKKL